MTDHDTALARAMYDDDGRPTAEGRQHLEHWSQQLEAELAQVARRWGAALLGIDVAGLPALFLLTSWPWQSVVGTWLAAMALALVAAVVANHRAQERRARDFLRRQLRLRELAGFESDGLDPAAPAASATAPAAPPGAARAGLAF